MKTKSFEQVLEESSPAVKKAYKKELKKLKTKPTVKKVSKKVTRCSICKNPFGNFDAIGIYDGKDCHSDCYPVNPPFFKVTNTTGLPTNTEWKEENNLHQDLSEEVVNDLRNSRFADKDFDFNKFPSAISRLAPRIEQALNNPPIIDFKKPTAFPYEIEGEPAFNCNKWTFMCLLLGIGLMLLATSHGDFLAVAWNLKH